ncbi:MAG: TrkH family potassium uptake protein [Thermus sp.]|uniref:TrkH family potassium uptake protein n=1 Tax=Thermus sp. TaxID=275 RepID=UPI0025D23431|nr:TrkH family potassium uptake protein [Thermus sp.]MCS7218097.1 TrkH family potassium uptake protein [Thermus sp.]MDW8017955.1 TrkH family potassium uptake protein [Thermus sp.]MDW8357695.1 TrkH family potassium uptake protein [Thermus sp.]
MRPWPASSARPGFRSSLYLLGLTYQGFGLLLAAFTLLAFFLGEDARGFALGAILGLGVGRGLQLLGHPQAQPKRAEVFATVALLWILVPALGAVPYWVSGGMPYLDALFEAVSGFTTTGATALQDFSLFGESLFLWRSLTQWMGGIGIVVLFLVIFPQLQVAGRQAFFAESTGVEKERLTPRLRHTAQAVLRVYVALTGMALLAYWLAGMPPFEALANALTTIPAGGFSPNPQSFATYAPLAQWLGTLFMFLAGVNFLLQYRLLFGREVGPLLRDAEFRAYGVLVLLAGLLLALYLYTHHLYGLEASLRHAFFQVVSILTTTGFASVDFAQWVVPAQAILVLLMFVGGSAGSGAGGIKVVRWLLLFGLLRREITRTLHPQAVLPLRLGQRVVSEEALRQVSVFVFLYTVLFGFGTLAVALLEGDFVVAFTASAQAIGNIGPGLGPIGPMGSYAGLHPLSKLVLILQMWAGRIEILPVVLLFSPELWRRLR